MAAAHRGSVRSVAGVVTAAVAVVAVLLVPQAASAVDSGHAGPSPVGSSKNKSTRSKSRSPERDRAGLAVRASAGRVVAKHWQVADLLAHFQPGGVAFVAKDHTPVMFVRTDTGFRLHTPEGEPQTVPAAALAERVDQLAGVPTRWGSRKLTVTTHLASGWWDPGTRWSLSAAVDLAGTGTVGDTVLFGRQTGQWLVLTRRDSTIEVTGPGGGQQTVAARSEADDLSRVHQRWPQAGSLQPLTPVSWLQRVGAENLPRLPVQAALALFAKLPPHPWSRPEMTVRFDTHPTRKTFRLSRRIDGSIRLEGPGWGRVQTDPETRAADIRPVTHAQLNQVLENAQHGADQPPLVGLNPHLPSPGHWVRKEWRTSIGPYRHWATYYNG